MQANSPRLKEQNTPNESGPQPPKLLERLRARMLARGFGLGMQHRYVEWCRRFILFHGKRHPDAMGAEEIEEPDDRPLGVVVGLWSGVSARADFIRWWNRK